MRAEQSKLFSNFAADTAAFPLYGGKFQVAAIATWGGGNLVLEQLGPDNTTWLPVHTALTANGVAVIDIPPGQFRFNITTATGIYAVVTRIPGD